MDLCNHLHNPTLHTKSITISLKCLRLYLETEGVIIYNQHIIFKKSIGKMFSLNISPKFPHSSFKNTPKKPTHNKLHLTSLFSSTTLSSSLTLGSVSCTSTNNAMLVEVPAGLSREKMPRHVAIIMDGNVRWAMKRGLLGGQGHEAGVKSLKQMVNLCVKWGIKVLTIFAFSYDNWARPRVEVEFLMSLFERGLNSELDSFIRQGIKISVIGDSTKLPKTLQNLILHAEKTTKNFKNMHLIIALSYSGKYDIIQACKNIAQKVKDNDIKVNDINEGLIEQELETNCTDYPNPDLLIRTSGEFRVSNFLLWQVAYTELFFAKALWPDFGEEDFVEALMCYQQRNRRFGGRN